MDDYSDFFFNLRFQIDTLEKLVNSLNSEDSSYSDYCRKFDILQHLEYFKKINGSIISGENFFSELR